MDNILILYSDLWQEEGDFWRQIPLVEALICLLNAKENLLVFSLLDHFYFEKVDDLAVFSANVHKKN